MKQGGGWSDSNRTDKDVLINDAVGKLHASARRYGSVTKGGVWGGTNRAGKGGVPVAASTHLRRRASHSSGVCVNQLVPRYASAAAASDTWVTAAQYGVTRLATSPPVSALIPIGARCPRRMKAAATRMRRA